MSEKIVIRPYDAVHQDQIFDLILPTQHEEFSIPITRQDQPDLEQIPDFYQKGAGNFWIALGGSVVVGTIGLKDIGNHQVALRKMFVRSDYRGKDKGVAKQLLERAIAWVRENKVTDVFLGTTAQFLAAHRFYEKSGFEEIDVAQLPASFPVMKVDTKFYRYRLK